MTHPELKSTFYLDILGVKKNPQSPTYTSLGIITKGTIIEVYFISFLFLFLFRFLFCYQLKINILIKVNVSDLGLVTETGKVIWGNLAQGILLVCFLFLHTFSYKQSRK